ERKEIRKELKDNSYFKRRAKRKNKFRSSRRGGLGEKI
ncbi:unnamed protein product, partial [marine sediment metagenome]